jgi:hypothetical protein
MSANVDLESHGRQVLAANVADHSRKFLLKLARDGANEFTGGGRGARRFVAGKHIVDKHLRCTSDSTANSHFLARIKTYTTGQ